jgi:hypothetical protein
MFDESIKVWNVNGVLYSNPQLLKNVKDILTIIEKLFTKRRFIE